MGPSHQWPGQDVSVRPCRQGTTAEHRPARQVARQVLPRLPGHSSYLPPNPPPWLGPRIPTTQQVTLAPQSLSP